MARQKKQQKFYQIWVFFQSGVKRQIPVRASSLAVAERRAIKLSGAEGLVYPGGNGES